MKEATLTNLKAWMVLSCLFPLMAGANIALYFVAFVQWVNRSHAPPASMLLFLLTLLPVVGACLVVFFARVDWQGARVLGFFGPVLLTSPAAFVAGAYLPLWLGWGVFALCVGAAFFLYGRFFPVSEG